jgi:hypothetical protein
MDRSEIYNIVTKEGLQPTLIVGLGGTGKILLTRLKARFLEEFGLVPPVIRFLSLDIDDREEVATWDSSQVKLEPKKEFIDVGDVDVGDIKQTLQEGGYKVLTSWFDPTTSLQESNLRKGAQQIRQLGRLAFFWHLGRSGTSLFDIFESAIAELTRQGALSQHGREDEESLKSVSVNVYVISSLCGGTGSGMFIDVAYVLRHIFQQRGMKKNATFIGVFITPKIFQSALQERLRANTLAALKELDYFMTVKEDEKKKKYSTINYLTGLTVSCLDTRPYNACYLIDAIAQSGVTIEGIENAAPMLVDAIFMQVGSRSGVALSSMINNVDSLKNIQDRTVYSTFGVASLVFPVDEVIGVCASRVARDVVREELLADLSDSARNKVRKEVETFLTNKRLGVEEINRRLTRDEKGQMLSGRLTDDENLKSRRLDTLARDVMFGSVTTRVDATVLPSLEAQAGKRLAEKKQDLVRDLVDDKENGLRAQVQSMVNDRERGLVYAVEFLRLLADPENGQFATLYSNLETNRTGAQSRKENAEKAQGKDRDQFRSTASARVVIGKGGLPKARDTFIQSSQAYLDRSFEVEGFVVAKQAISSAISVAESLRRDLEVLIGHVRWMADSYCPDKETEFLNTIRNLDAVRRKSVVDEKHINDIYSERKQDAHYKTLTGLYGGEGKLYGLLGKERNQILERVFTVASDALHGEHGIDRIRLEDKIEQMEREESRPRRKWLITTEANATLFWAYRKAEDANAGRIAEHTMVIGVQNAGNSIFKTDANEKGTMFESTGNPYRLTVLNTEHGLTYFTMSQYETYANEYKNAIIKGKPIHAFPEFAVNGSDERKAGRTAFYLGFAYGLITRRGPKEYHYNPSKKKGTVDRILSERGMFDALWAFVRDDELVATVKKQVETLEYKSGKSKAGLVCTLNEFAETLRVPVDDEAWAEELKAVIQSHIQDLEY